MRTSELVKLCVGSALLPFACGSSSAHIYKSDAPSGGDSGASGVAVSDGGKQGTGGAASEGGAIGSGGSTDRLEQVYDSSGLPVDGRYLDTETGLECEFAPTGCAAQSCLPADVSVTIVDAYAEGCAVELEVVFFSSDLPMPEYVVVETTLSCATSYAYIIGELPTAWQIDSSGCYQLLESGKSAYQIIRPVPTDVWYTIPL